MDLTGQLLIAMPGMGDPRFARAVLLICAHSGDGAMGLILNRPLQGMTLREVFTRLDIDAKGAEGATPVHIGGPVETERGFVLHADAGRLAPDALTIGGGYVLTATQDILSDIATGTGPAPFFFALGYAGWGAGQLEGEIAQNAWLTAPAPADIVFPENRATLWEAALRSIGIDPVTLSGAAGRA